MIAKIINNNYNNYYYYIQGNFLYSWLGLDSMWNVRTLLLMKNQFEGLVENMLILLESWNDWLQHMRLILSDDLCVKWNKFLKPIYGCNNGLFISFFFVYFLFLKPTEWLSAKMPISTTSQSIFKLELKLVLVLKKIFWSKNRKLIGKNCQANVANILWFYIVKCDNLVFSVLYFSKLDIFTFWSWSCLTFSLTVYSTMSPRLLELGMVSFHCLTFDRLHYFSELWNKKLWIIKEKWGEVNRDNSLIDNQNNNLAQPYLKVLFLWPQLKSFKVWGARFISVS